MKYLYLIAVFCLFSCQQVDKNFTDEDKKQVEVEVNEMFAAYNKAVNEQGIVGELPYLDSSAEFFWVPPGYDGPINYAEVVSHAQQATAKFKRVKVAWQDLKIYPKTKDLAVYTGTLEFNTEDTAGITSHAILLETGVIVKHTDGWKLQSGQTALKQ